MPKFYLSIFQRRFAVLMVAAALSAVAAHAQSVGNSGSVNGTVLDSTGAVVPQAKVELRNPVSGLDRTATTDSSVVRTVRPTTFRQSSSSPAMA